MPDVAPTNRLFIGCAGWNIPSHLAANFPKDGSHLERYAGGLGAVEINTSFYRPHRPSTYARWAASVPGEFKFSVKVPKQVTHGLRLRDAEQPIEQFLQEAGALGDCLGCFLVQLPPSLQLEAEVADPFFTHLRGLHRGNIACEPRHATWFSPAADALLQKHSVARVAADPALHPDADEPAGYTGFQYFRLHGSPRTYYSRYSVQFLAALAKRFASTEAEAREVWCIFDNTAAGHATENAIELQSLVNEACVSGRIEN